MINKKLNVFASPIFHTSMLKDNVFLAIFPTTGITIKEPVFHVLLEPLTINQKDNAFVLPVFHTSMLKDNVLLATPQDSGILILFPA